MARFSIYGNPEGQGFLLGVQANLLSHLDTRMVVPLLPAASAPTPAQTLNPMLEVHSTQYVIATQYVAAARSMAFRIRTAHQTGSA